MKPVLILQHQTGDGPAYLATWLRRRGLRYELRNTEAGDPFPDALAGYCALAILGGEMGANDPLPSLRQAEALILQGVRDGVPVIGHCLGGQLMARALGARVARAAVPEIGWQPLTVADNPAAAAWLGAAGPRLAMQWHFDAFDLPPGAQPLAGSALCAQQAFAVGPHLAMQFHVEIDAHKLLRWAAEDSASHREAVRRHASAQSAEAIRAGIATQMKAHQAWADHIYGAWLRGCAGFS